MFEYTEETALSRAVDAEPPKLIVAMVGLPEERAEVETKLRPETLIWSVNLLRA